MFGTLIRRKNGLGASADEALETTLFSLTTDVPRPTDNRADERLLALLPVAKLVAADWQDLCRIRNISAGGIMAETTMPHETGTAVRVELASGQEINSQIIWVRGTILGIKFDQTVDLREVLAARRPRIGFRPRPARLEIKCGGTIKLNGLYHKVEVKDISLGGIKIFLPQKTCVGKDVLVTIESLRAIKGTIRWQKEGLMGIVFHHPLSFDELAEWLGKRIEVASLRASTQPVFTPNTTRPNRYLTKPHRYLDS
jgi:PilZ domain-containing protein